MASITELLAAYTPQRKKMPCAACRVLEVVPATDRAALTAAMNDDGDKFTAAGLFRLLKDAGHEVPAPSISRHRRGECAAP